VTIVELVKAVDAAAPLEALPESVTERRAIREGAGVTLHLAAAAVGVSVPSIDAWEKGARTPRLRSEHRYRKLLSACQAAGRTK
jgi:DNA-binding transcriptional regulator YiaG